MWRVRQTQQNLVAFRIHRLCLFIQFGNLIAKGADVNAATDVGTTPLHLAVSGGHTEIAKLLIANG
ncbi:MAG: ankyrin repeat domain-containing protein, partial [Limisphaerales bacterium]